MVLFLDCASAPDESQRLLFGWYRVVNAGVPIDEGLFPADDLDEASVRELRRLLLARPTSLSKAGAPRLLSKAAFLKEVFFPLALDAQGLVVGYGLPYELSRLAVGWSVARKPPFAGGFSLIMGEYFDKQGRKVPDRLTPRIAIKSIDSNRSLIGFTSAWMRGIRKGHAPKGKRPRHHRGLFLDLKALAYALLGEGLAADESCRTFGVTDRMAPKPTAFSAEVVDVLLQRANAMQALYSQLLNEYKRLAVSLPPWEAYSPASIGKQYLREIGVRVPQLVLDPSLQLSSDDVKGIAMSAYHAGRAEVRVRCIPVHVVYGDFLSMYATVAALMRIWEFATAKEIRVEDSTEDIRRLLDGVSHNGLFDREKWRPMSAFVEIEPNEDILPTRAWYKPGAHNPPSSALNPTTSREQLWFTLPDVIYSKLRTGITPRICRAIRLRPVGHQKTRPIEIFNGVTFDPRADDLFRKLVELRRDNGNSPGSGSRERELVQHILKQIDNPLCYGISVELNRQEGKAEDVEVFGVDHFATRVTSPEEPGEFYLPPLAAIVTGGARLMLGLAEGEVEKRGGTYSYMDTDSIAIVATPQAGLVPCEGGGERLPNGTAAIKAISWDETQEIVRQFDALNPYDKNIVPGSILKLEKENFAEDLAREKRQVELRGYFVAAKRYVLFNLENERIKIRKPSKHVIGTYLPPTNPENGEPIPNWVDEAWRHVLKMDTPNAKDSLPAWANQIALREIAISRPEMMKWLRKRDRTRKYSRANSKKSYAESMKPFNTLQHVTPQQIPQRPGRISKAKSPGLIAPYSAENPAKRRWTDLRDPNGSSYRIVTGKRENLDETTILVKSYRELIEDLPFHPEPKSLGPDGKPCNRDTRGLLGRRPICVEGVKHIGKEANEYELVQAGLVEAEEEVLTTYPQNSWDLIPQVLSRITAQTIRQAAGCSKRAAYYYRNAQRKPRRKTLKLLTQLAARFAFEELRSNGETLIPEDDVQTIRQYLKLVPKIGE